MPIVKHTKLLSKEKFGALDSRVSTTGAAVDSRAFVEIAAVCKQKKRVPSFWLLQIIFDDLSRTAVSLLI